MFVSLVPMLFSQSNQCVFIGSYAFRKEAKVCSLVPMLFIIKPLLVLLVPMLCIIKPLLFRWFLCFPYKNHVSFVGSYAFYIKPMLFCWLLSFLQSSQCFFVGSHAFCTKNLCFFVCSDASH